MILPSTRLTAIFVSGDSVSPLPVPLTAVIEVFTLSTEPREFAEDPAGKAFHGAPSALVGFIAQRGARTGWVGLQFDGEKRTYFYERPAHVAGLLALEAPPWVRTRIGLRDSLANIRAAVDTLGDGLQRYEPGTKLPLGTWVFLKGEAFGVVVSHAGDGQPGALLTQAKRGLDYVPFQAALAQAWWKPSASARRYTEERNDEAYVDLCAELGRLRLWAHLEGDHALTDSPFFKHTRAAGEPHMHAPLVALLNKGPSDQNDWIAYLMDYGEGIQPAGKARPGDFLFLSNGRGIALDNGEMLFVTDDKLRIGPQRQVKYVWRPTARKREADSA